MKTKILFVVQSVFFLALLNYSCSADKNKFTSLEDEFPTSHHNMRSYIDSASSELLRNPSFFYTAPEKSMQIVKVAAEHQMRERVRRLMISYFLQDSNYSLADDLLTFANIYREELGDRAISNFIHLSFVEEFVTDTRWDSIAVLLPETMRTTEDEIEKEFRKIFGPDGELESFVAASRFMIFAEIYALSKPENPASPEYLFQASEVAKAIDLTSRSNFNIRWIIDKFKAHDVAPNALFFKAFSQGEMEGDQKKSLQLYQEFLLYYPDHELAESARLMIQAAGIGSEQFLKTFKMDEN